MYRSFVISCRLAFDPLRWPVSFLVQPLNIWYTSCPLARFPDYWISWVDHGSGTDVQLPFMGVESFLRGGLLIERFSQIDVAVQERKSALMDEEPPLGDSARWACTLQVAQTEEHLSLRGDLTGTQYLTVNVHNKVPEGSDFSLRYATIEICYRMGATV